MDLAHLRYFKAIVEHGSMTAAARTIGCTQPTLTAAVHRLEARFGTTLLLRSARGVSATATGLELLRHTADLLAVLERAERCIAGLENAECGSFVFGCHDSLGAYYLPGFMAHFMPAHPGIDLVLWNGASRQVYQRILDREVHFGLIVNPPAHPDLVLVDLFSDTLEIFTLTPATSLDQARRRLQEEPVVVAEGFGQSQSYLEQLGNLGVKPTRLLNCGELALVKSLTVSGIGAGVLPARVAADTPAGERALHRLHPELPRVPGRVVLAYHADLHRTRAALALKDALVAHGRELAARPPAP